VGKRDVPTLGEGKLCYLQIPSLDVDESAEFYRAAFGWNIRAADDGSTSFDDGVGEVSGSWVTGRPPSGDAGLVIYVMVGDAAAAVARVEQAGGEVVRPLTREGEDLIAWFRDPTGNLMGVYEQPRLAELVAEQAAAGAEPGA
jgi:predicted enzyme related to lactoylglutathione lyase